MTVMLCVVAPVLHVLPVAELEVSVTLPPEQKVVGPLAVTVGEGLGLTVTVTGDDVVLHVLSVTVKVPELTTLIEGVIAPLLHIILFVMLLVNVTLSPWQKVVGPLAVIAGLAVFTFTTTVSVTSHTPPIAVITYVVVATGVATGFVIVSFESPVAGVHW